MARLESPLVLVTCDDGIESPGLRAAVREVDAGEGELRFLELLAKCVGEAVGALLDRMALDDVLATIAGGFAYSMFSHVQGRIEAWIDDRTKRWKLSPMDLEARRQWFAYSRARDAMLDATDTPESPWHIVDNNDKYRGRLNCIRHLLDQLPYETFERPSVELPGRDESDAYDDVASMSGRRYVPEHY